MIIDGKVNAWVFDCDGVLLDTVAAKVAAFRAWVPEEQAHLRDEFNRYNLASFGQSRRVQLRYFHEQMLGHSLAEEELTAEVQRFAGINLALVGQACWLPGSREFLQHASARGTPLFVLSGTPESELQEQLRQRGVDGLFCGIIGSPVTKVAGLRRIVAELGVAPSSVWFVGDATHDHYSAREAGTGFVYKPSEASFQANCSVQTVHSLMELLYD